MTILYTFAAWISLLLSCAMGLFFATEFVQRRGRIEHNDGDLMTPVEVLGLFVMVVSMIVTSIRGVFL